MKSFVDNFTDKRISIELLKKMVEENYQANSLLELAIKNYQVEYYDIDIISQYILKLKGLKNTVFILLSSNKDTLELVNEQTKTIKNKLTIIVFDQTDKFNTLENKVFISTNEWMNRIITHGINRKIMHLQFLRDMIYYYA
jgi:uncharacterized membrane protein YvbJ